MKFLVSILALSVCLSISARAQEDNDISKYRLRRAPAKKAVPVAQAAKPSEDLSQQAMKELMLAPEDISMGVLPTPATVRSRIDEVRNPIRPLKYRLGVSVQPFEPKGMMSVSNLAPYDLARAGVKPMVAIDAQWLPFTFDQVAGLQAGFFASIGYAQHALTLQTPSGVSLGDTTLHSLKAQIGATASYQLPRSPLWSFHANLGGGQLQSVQSSISSYANSSSSAWFGSAGISAERSILPNLSVFVADDVRVVLSRSTAGADVPLNNIMIGFLGNFE